MGSTKFYLILTIHQLGPNFDNAHCPLFLWPHKDPKLFFFLAERSKANYTPCTSTLHGNGPLTTWKKPHLWFQIGGASHGHKNPKKNFAKCFQDPYMKDIINSKKKHWKDWWEQKSGYLSH